MVGCDRSKECADTALCFWGAPDDERKAAAGLEDARNLAEDSMRACQVMNDKVARDGIEDCIVKRQILCIGFLESGAGVSLASDIDHGAREVDACDDGSEISEGARDMTRAATKIEDLVSGPDACGVPEELHGLAGEVCKVAEVCLGTARPSFKLVLGHYIGIQLVSHIRFPLCKIEQHDSRNDQSLHMLRMNRAPMNGRRLRIGLIGPILLE